MRRRTLGISLTLIVILLAIAALAAFASVRISALAQDLQDASAASDRYVAALYDEPEAASRHLQTAIDELQSAQHGLDTWTLTALSQTPQLGDNVAAVRTVTDEMHTLLSDAGPVLSTAAEVVDFRAQKLRPLPESGTWFASIDDAGQAIDKATDVIRDAPAAIEAFDAAQQKIHDIDTAGLLPPVRDAIDELDTTLTEAAEELRPLLNVMRKLADSDLYRLLSGAIEGIGDAIGKIDLDSMFRELEEQLKKVRTPIGRGG